MYEYKSKTVTSRLLLDSVETSLLVIFILIEAGQFLWPNPQASAPWIWYVINYVENIIVILIVISDDGFKRAIRNALAKPWGRYDGWLFGLITLFSIVWALFGFHVVLNLGREWMIPLIAIPPTFVYPDISHLSVLPWFDITVGLILVAVSEEFVFRAVVFDSLSRRKFSTPAIVILSSIAFGLVHISSGIPHALVTMILGSVFMMVYIRKQSLWSLVLAHYVINLWAYSDYHFN